MGGVVLIVAVEKNCNVSRLILGRLFVIESASVLLSRQSRWGPGLVWLEAGRFEAERAWFPPKAGERGRKQSEGEPLGELSVPAQDEPRQDPIPKFSLWTVGLRW